MCSNELQLIIALGIQILYNLHNCLANEHSMQKQGFGEDSKKSSSLEDNVTSNIFVAHSLAQCLLYRFPIN